jgi:hypothetical protein
VKSPLKLQEKLLNILEGTPALSILPPSSGWWQNAEFEEVAWIVEDFVNANLEVVENDPLKDWLEEYKFAIADSKGQKSWLENYKSPGNESEVSSETDP